MTKLYLPAPSIPGSLKPDFPVEIDRSKPLGAAVISAWLINGAGSNTDLGGVGQIVWQSTTLPTTIINAKGRAVQTVADASYFLGSSSSMYSFGTGEFTLGVYFSGFIAADTRVLIAQNSGVGDNYWLGQSGATPTFSISGASVSGPGVINDGKPHLLTGTRKSGNFYCGVDSALGTGAANVLSASPAGGIAIGKLGTGGSFIPAAQFSFGFVFNQGNYTSRADFTRCESVLFSTRKATRSIFVNRVKRACILRIVVTKPKLFVRAFSFS